MTDLETRLHDALSRQAGMIDTELDGAAIRRQAGRPVVGRTSLAVAVAAVVIALGAIALVVGPHHHSRQIRPGAPGGNVSVTVPPAAHSSSVAPSPHPTSIPVVPTGAPNPSLPVVGTPSSLPSISARGRTAPATAPR